MIVPMDMSLVDYAGIFAFEMISTTDGSRVEDKTTADLREKKLHEWEEEKKQAK